MGVYCISAQNSLCVSSDRELQGSGRNRMSEIKEWSRFKLVYKQPWEHRMQRSLPSRSRPGSATAARPRADPRPAPGNKAVCALKAMGYGGEGCLKHVTLNCVGGSQGAGHLHPSEVWFQSASPGASPIVCSGGPTVRCQADK